MVDGYLRYQRTLLVKAHPLQPAAGVEQRADLDEKARLEAGLTLDDVLKIEAMLGRVSARRLTFRLMELDEKMPEPPAADPQDSARTAEAAQAGQAQLKRAQLKKSIQNMTEERQAFGDQNIDVLLQREEELMKNWSLMMEVPELSQPGH